MNKIIFVLLTLFVCSTTLAQNDSLPKQDYKFSIGKSILNKKLWSQPYRYEIKATKTLSVEINIKRLHRKNEELDFNLFALTDETKKWRIRPVAIYYYKADRKIYLKSKPVNLNYNVFEKYQLEGYEDFEAKIYKTNFLGIKKKRKVGFAVPSLRKMKIKNSKTTYYLDFPVRSSFDYGKVYFKDKTIGFTGVKE